MSSRKIGEFTNKAHKDIMRDIRVMLEKLLGERKFTPTYYLDR